MTKIGERVIAISCVKDGIVYYYGEGVYTGDFLLPPEARGFNFGQENPRIDLDNGKTVYGCECWWGPIDKVKTNFESLEWVVVDIEEERNN